MDKFDVGASIARTNRELYQQGLQKKFKRLERAGIMGKADEKRPKFQKAAHHIRGNPTTPENIERFQAEVEGRQPQSISHNETKNPIPAVPRPLLKKAKPANKKAIPPLPPKPESLKKKEVVSTDELLNILDEGFNSCNKPN